MKTRKNGLTIIELLIVVIILGLFAAAILAFFQNRQVATWRSNYDKRIQTSPMVAIELDGHRKSIDLRKIERGEKPDCLYATGYLAKKSANAVEEPYQLLSIAQQKWVASEINEAAPNPKQTSITLLSFNHHHTLNLNGC